MKASDLQGMKVYRLPAPEKRTKKDGTPRDPKKLGKIHFPVFTKDGRRVVGYMVKLPDVVGMIKQNDRFVALDAIDVYEGVIAVKDQRDTYDAAAAKRLGVNLDDCLIWTGMDVRTKSGKVVGYCADATFSAKTGTVSSFAITSGAASSMLLGNVEMPVSYLLGYKQGYMVVSDDIAGLNHSGGVAAKAAEASVVVGDKVKKGTKVLDDKGSAALDKGSRALGKQLGKTRGMFSAFADEYKKAAGTSKTKK